MDEEQGELDFNEEDFLEVKIDNISVSNLGFLVFLKAEGDNRVLPIFIGPNEAHSIAMAFNNQVPPRPLTHDLLKNILGFLDCELTKVLITSLSENTFYSRVYLKREGVDEMDVDARPSDAIALALRYQAPIFAHKSVFEAGAVFVKEETTSVVTEEDGTETQKTWTMLEPPGANSSPEPSKNPAERLKDALQQALARERYEEAAKIRDQLKRMEIEN